jgi:lantibiotic biosynthesis protein
MMAAKRRKFSPDRLLVEAASWGDMLCQEAYWHEDRCSWVGHSPDESPQDGPLFSGVTSLGPDLYAGTAGVALFLAQLHVLRPEARYRRAALGAIRHALRHADDVDAAARVGLHIGVTGVAFASARAGLLLGIDDLVAEGVALATRAADEAGDRPYLDFVSGSSSAICALLVMSRYPGGDGLHGSAEALGRDIIGRAARDNGWSWSNADVSGGTQWARPLNGLAHGAAGLGIALIELHAKTGDPAFRDAGLGAFDYEDQFVNDAKGNWDDLRVDPAADAGAGSMPHTLAWCHGAPGISLTRLRAHQVLPDRGEHLRGSIAIALRGTLQHARSQLEGSAFDVTSCHGLAGLIEPFVLASQVFGDPSYLSRARELWGEAFHRRDEKATWMSGVGTGGKNPSLMLGSAGLGYGLLRAFDPERVPSVLLPF